MADLTNAQIAAAFDELGDLYELDGAVSYRVIAYRTAAKAVRESSVSVVGLSREGRVTELSGVGKTLEEKIKALDETGDIPTSKKLRDKFPTGLISVMHLPGFGPKRARRLYDELGIDSLDALRAAAEQQKIRGLRGFGAKVEEQLLEDARASRRRAARRRASCSRARRTSPSRSSARCAPHPAAERVEVAGSLRRQADSVKDLDIIATAQDPVALSAALAELPLVESVLSAGDARRARAHALGHEGRPQGRRARPVRQRAPALHRLQGAQRGAARGGRAARACTSRSTGSSTTRRARRCAARPRRRSTSASASSGSRRSCARAAASSRRRRTGALPAAADARRTSAATCTATRRCPTAARRSSRWPRPRARAGSSTSPSPTTPRRTASATTSRRRRSRRGSRRSTRSTRRSTASSC